MWQAWPCRVILECNSPALASSQRPSINDGAAQAEEGRDDPTAPIRRDGIRIPACPALSALPRCPKLLVPRDTLIPTADSLAGCQFENSDCAMEAKGTRLPGPGETSGPAETMPVVPTRHVRGGCRTIYLFIRPSSIPTLRNRPSSRSHDDIFLRHHTEPQ